MASRPTGSEKLLEIRTATADLAITTKGKRTAIGKRSSSLRVVASDAERISIPVLGITEEYGDHKGIAIHEFPVDPLFFEQTDYLITVQSRNGEELTFRSGSDLIADRVSNPIEGNRTLLTGIINYGNEVGYSDLIVEADGKTVISLRIEVYPTKISYREDYRAMMDDINSMVSEAVLDFMRKAFQLFVPAHTKSELPAVFFAILEGIYRDFVRAAERILAVPHHRLISEHTVVPQHKARQTDHQSLAWLRKHPQEVRRTKEGIRAERVLAVRKRITYDTPENRLVRFMLNKTARRIRDFADRYARNTKTPSEQILGEAQRMERGLRRLVDGSFLNSVSEYSAVQSMSLVFGMAPGYRELYRYYLMLQNGLNEGGEVFRMSYRDTAQLYEYWCFLKLYSILKERYSLRSPDPIRVDRSGVTVDLVRGRNSRIDFVDPRTGERFTLSYNPSESVTQTVNQRPDNVLELQKRGSKTLYKYIFDAKYRIESDPGSAYYPDSKPGPKLDDINTMHRYRDAIVYENPESRFTFEKTMFGAYILFPYGEEEQYREHRFYKSIGTVNIGGLPFLPSATTLVTELLDDLIADSPESAFERATLPAGIESRLAKTDWSRRDVLIGTFRSNAQYEACLEHRFYYIPAARIREEALPVRYVALYRTPRVFSDHAGISLYGEVIRTELVPRSAITEVPQRRGSSPGDRYYRFTVREWKELNRPILPKESGFIHAFTNLFLLEHSEFVPELLLTSEEEYRLYTELKRRTGTAMEDNGEAAGFELGGIRVQFTDRQILILRDGSIVSGCGIDTFSRHPNTTFREILRDSGGQLQPTAEREERVPSQKQDKSLRFS